MTDSLQATEAECAAGAKAPRISLAFIESHIQQKLFTTADKAFFGRDGDVMVLPRGCEPLHVMTLCALVMSNGFVIIGKSAPASPENFNEELGRKLAYEDAVRQLWPLFGFQLRTLLTGP